MQVLVSKKCYSFASPTSSQRRAAI